MKQTSTDFLDSVRLDREERRRSEDNDGDAKQVEREPVEEKALA